MRTQDERSGAQLAAALVGLIMYGLGLGWTMGGRRCVVCRSAPS